MAKRFICLLLAALLALGCAGFAEDTAAEGKTVKILFTHDMHSYFENSSVLTADGVRQHGGAARLMTLLKENRNENTLYLDAGDFAMGTLLHANYATDAYELRILGRLGCAATTFGNHEFDFGGTGAAQMLESALASGDPLPQLVQANMIAPENPTDEQRALLQAMQDYGAKPYTMLEVNGLRIGVFGLLGINGIECAPTSGMEFENYIEAAKKTVAEIEAAGADVIICLSHCGTRGDGEHGEDIDLAKKVPAIDLIISGHSHSEYAQPVVCGDTIIASAGEYLTNLGSVTLRVVNGKVTCDDYRLIPCDDTVAEDPEMLAVMAEYKRNIAEGYLADEGCGYDDVICHSDFDFMPLDEMYATHQEYPLGNLIADSYIYEAEQNGIDDIDVALVGLGTIRGSIKAGDITVSDAFEICSLGVGADGSAGHPIMSCWITGKDLKLLVELDASLGTLVSSIKMSYSGLRYTFNTKRMLLDRAYDIRIVRRDGSMEEIENDKLYRVACNMYAANMLGMLNGLTKGILSITPRNADGEPIDSADYYDYSLVNREGREIKEWVAFKDYLAAMPEKDGIPTIPESYAAPEGRKEKVSEGGLAVIAHPGLTTIIMICLTIVLLALVVLIPIRIRRRRLRRKKKK